jgi:hypothetical protein
MQRQGGRLAEAHETAGVHADEHELAAFEAPACGHVRLPEGQRVRHDLEPLDLH